MVPQLRDVPPKQLFEREKYAPVKGYPEPIVKHAEARARALDFFKANL
jgi:deoxyribodipyrimidine photolyase